MHLKALEIQGFKSFPEKTVIEFHKGVTAIIGPNGSGKSNVTDAIRWVLGEQSVKTLRGARMEDVIFTGTQSRRPMSYAEVTMIIDNNDSKLPLEYTEIQVTRRLYRSGESEYLLNKTACRLRDIAMLFMDTGLGRDGYSIVGQGRIDDILSHRSEDRRKIFEEASGIVKFKTRKDEAERKLQNTEQNLLRINDIINELETRLEPLAEQSAAARRYLALHDELKGTEIALMLDNIDQNQQNLAEARLEIQLLQDDLNREANSLAALKEKNRQTSENLHILEDKIEQNQKAYNHVSTAISELNGQIALGEERIRQLTLRLETSAVEEKDLMRSLGNLDEELAGRKKKEENLNRQQTIYRSQLEDAEKEMQDVLQTLDAAEKATEQMKERLDLLLERLFETRSLLTQTKGQTNLVESRRKTIATEQRDLISDRDRLNLLIEEAETQLRQIRQTAAKDDAERQSVADALDVARTEVDHLARKIDADKQILQNREYRHHTLTELERSYEGYGEAVRRLLHQAESDRDFGRGIRGTLGSLIRADKSCETAIETALGPAIQNIVTDTEATAARLIDHLKSTRSGRATFLPIASIQGRSLENNMLEKVKSLQGYVGLGSELVRFDSDLSNIIEFLLGRVVVAENLDNAVQMARKINYGCRIVTLEGDVINPGGSMTGGYNRSTGTGVLSRARELTELQQDIDRLKKTVSDDAKALPGLEEVLQDHGRRLADLDRLAIDHSHLRIREESRLLSLQQDLAKTGARQEMLQAEDNQLSHQTSEIDSEITRIEQDIAGMEGEINAIRKTVSEQEGANRSEQARRDDLRETITDLRVSLNSIEESLQSASEMASRIEQERLSQTQRIARHQRDQADSQNDIARIRDEIVGLMDLTAERQNAGTAIINEVRRLGEEKAMLESEQASFFDLLEQSTAKTSALQGEITRSEAKAGRYENLIDDIKNRLWEEYEMTADQATEFRRPLESRNEAARRVSQLKNEMKQLGPVNISAIEENQAVQERYRFMTGQRDDIEASRHKLTEVIDELTEAMKAQFVEHFRLINENFKIVFSELFGGGIAELNLENEQDVLACGIEIKAQPPGKKLQNLMLLSGGERCLTAIALLFAILKLRPTPFCVLDEVEAALDDANVSRFTEYIRRYAEDAQFILVTHRKGTMEAADRLYGVTMQERGISRILSMQLSE